MTLNDFRATLNDPQPPAGLPIPLQALWHEVKGNLETAHTLLQNDNTPESAWVHAYLHRKEGDRTNASFWYWRAGKPMFEDALDEEWTQIATALLTHTPPEAEPLAD